MGMFNIPLNIQQPQMTPTPVSPLVAQQQRLQLQQLAGATQIQRQVQQENALKLEAAAQDKADDEAFQNAFTQNNGDWDKTLSAVAPTVRARNLAKYTADHQKIVQTAHELASSADLANKTKFAAIKANNELIGQALDGVMQAPDEAKDEVYQNSLANLAKQGVDVSQFPPTRPPDNVLQSKAASIGYLGKILHNADIKAQEEQRKAAASRAAAAAARTDAEEAAKDRQRGLVDAATDHLSVTNQEQHDQWLADLQQNHPEIAARMKNLKTFNEDTQEAIQNMALTPDQRIKKVAKEREDAAATTRAAASGGIPGLISRAHDPTLSEDQRKAARESADESEARLTRISRAGAGGGRPDPVKSRYDRTEVTKDSAAHQNLQVKEVDAWAMRARYGDAIARAEKDGSKEIKDPKNGRAISIEDARIVADGLKDKATIYQNQARQLRSKHGWGEFGDDAGAEEAINQAAAAPAPAQPPTAPVQAAPQVPPKAAAPTATSTQKAAPVSMNYNGQVYSVGQVFKSKSTGKNVKIVGFKDGKPLTETVP